MASKGLSETSQVRPSTKQHSDTIMKLFMAMWCRCCSQENINLSLAISHRNKNSEIQPIPVDYGVFQYQQV